MKRMALVAAVGLLLVLSELSAADSTTQPTSQDWNDIATPSKQPGAASKAETFLLVEVKGTIGKDFTAAKIKAALAEARKAKATAVVLSMDTPGGSVAEAEAIVNLIIQNKDLRFIALVHRALSAGAAITLACKEIYVTETATLGAAVSYVPNRRGVPIALPADVAEKYQSAWRAVCRKAADHGGHSSLLAEGMVDPGFAITMRRVNGKVILERDGKGELVKARGRILTLTAKEAVKCGLAKALVPDVKRLGAKLSIRQGGVASGTTAEGPAQFYDLLSDKIDALGLTGNSLTELGRKTANKEWDSWLKSQLSKVRGTRVSWTLVLVEAKAPKRGTFELYATPASRRRPFVLVTANVRKAHKDVVASIPSGSTIILTGKLVDVRIESRWRSDGKFRQIPHPEQIETNRVVIQVDDCAVGDTERGHPFATPKSPVSAPVDPEGEAKQRLSLGKMYRDNRMKANALKILRSIIEDFPNTAAAKEAAEQVRQLLDGEAKKTGKGSSVP